MEKILLVNQVNKRFLGVHAVNNVSFDVLEGEILGLIGPNGSGKSTLVNVISGFEKADSGSVNIDGIDITRESISKINFLGIARTFQSPKPFLSMTVYESIFIDALVHKANKKQAQRATDEVIDLMGFSDISDVLCSKLSIEKRKWLDMARVLPSSPKLLMLDECLAGLNPFEMDSSIELIKKINSMGIAVLFIEHVMSAVVKLCHRVIVLNEGSVLCEGTPQSVMNDPNVIEAYLGGDFYAKD